MVPVDRMRLEPVGTESRVDRVFEQLRAQIVSGAIAAGSQLPNERALAEAFAVNRGSVREALKRLEFLELVEVRHGQGTFVCDLSASSALQVIEGLANHFGVSIAYLVGEDIEAADADQDLARMFRLAGELEEHERRVIDDMIESFRRRRLERDGHST